MFKNRCTILDSHLEKLAKQHLEARFIKLNVEKAPFLTQRLGIRVIPTMSIVKDGKTLVSVSHLIIVVQFLKKTLGIQSQKSKLALLSIEFESCSF